MHYPGMPDHPAAELVGRQMRVPGAMLSIELRGGEDQAKRFAGATRLFTLAESLGAVESLIEVPAPMTHASVAESPLAVPGGLVRLSVGHRGGRRPACRPGGGIRRIGLVTDDRPREDGPTELVETETGDLVERLSGGTATLLLVWLIGVGALSTLLAAWLYVWLVFGARLGVGHLLSGFGLYTALAGASGPCVLWLAGRAQGHTLGWFMLTGAKDRARDGGDGARHSSSSRHSSWPAPLPRSATRFWRGRSWWLPLWRLPRSGRSPPGPPTAGSGGESDRHSLDPVVLCRIAGLDVRAGSPEPGDLAAIRLDADRLRAVGDSRRWRPCRARS